MISIKIKIGSEQRTLAEANPDCINQQINRRRNDSEAVCVRISVECPGIRLVLSTPDCPTGGGTRRPNREEERILLLWEERGLSRRDFTGGNVVAFLKQLDDLVGSCRPSPAYCVADHPQGCREFPVQKALGGLHIKVVGT